MRTSTHTTISNGMRTTITEVTDEQGVTTKTIENPDGSRQVFVNGQPAAIGGGDPPRNIEGNSRRPIYIVDDDDEQEVHGGGGGGGSNPFGRSSGRTNNMNNSGYRSDLGDRRSSVSSSTRGQSYASEQGRRSTAAEPIVLDEDEDEDMYEEYSQDDRGERDSRRRHVVDDQDDDPNLFHPRMGRGQSK